MPLRAESSIILNKRTPINILVMLAALDTVPGTKSILFLISALPEAPIHVPLASFIKREMPGNPSFLYFSNKLLKAAFLGCRLLLSAHGQAGPACEVDNTIS